MEVKKNNRYENGKIYTIRSHQTDKYYIGSTCLELYKRLWFHRNNYKRFQDGKTNNNITSFEILKYDDHYIELLEVFKCNSKDELTKREGYFIRELKNEIVNRKIEGRTIKEWRKDNKNFLSEQMKLYANNNKDKIKEYKEKYAKDNVDKIKIKKQEKCLCECGTEIIKDKKSRHIKSQKHINLVKKL